MALGKYVADKSTYGQQRHSRYADELLKGLATTKVGGKAQLAPATAAPAS